MTVVIDIGILIVWFYGLFALSRLAYVKSTPWRHKAINHKAYREALTLNDTDRFVRDQEHEIWPDKKLDHVDCAVCGPGPLKQGMVPSRYGHPFFVKGIEERSDGYGTWKIETVKAALAENAEMVSSQVIEDGTYTGKHTLMLDLDFPVTLVESTTTGHYHLYADHLMTWRQYRGVLKAMSEAGLIEQAYYRAAVRQSATMLRPPWVKKGALDYGGVVRARSAQQRMVNALNNLKQRK
jgi:hypothetical protein